MERCLIIPRFFLALMIFSLICFLKERAESSVRPRCYNAILTRKRINGWECMGPPMPTVHLFIYD